MSTLAVKVVALIALMVAALAAMVYGLRYQDDLNRTKPRNRDGDDFPWMMPPF